MSKVQKTEAEVVTLNPTIISLSDNLKANITLGDAGVFTVSKDAFEKTLPEGLTMDTFKRVGDHLTNVSAALYLAVGEVAIDAKVDNASANLPINKCMGLSASYRKKYQVPNGNMEAPGMVPAYGGVQIALKFTGGKTRGEMKVVKRHVTALATEAFGE